MSQYAPTRRQIEVLDLLLAGQDPPQVARTLHISPHTCAHHLAELRRHFGAPHTLGLVALVWERRHAACRTQLAECERVKAALDRRGKS